MSDWASLLQKPDNLHGADNLEGWFTPIASRLLNGSRLVLGGQPHRFVEVEFYYHGAGHPDPFTHRDPLQLQCGRWYFHRTNGIYRGGSFKGFDLTFGDGSAFGGVLIRGIETPEGALIDGPSLCVDYLLRRTASQDVASLDRTIGGRVAWASDNPLFLEETTEEEGREVFRSARVGLSLKRARRGAPEPPRYLMCPYRHLTEPRRTSKGKLYLVLALHAQGVDPEDIRRLTGCPRQTIQRYLADFEAGRQEDDFTPYFGKDLGPRDLCRLYGLWQAKWGAEMKDEG